jgi:hypothetical protein
LRFSPSVSLAFLASEYGLPRRPAAADGVFGDGNASVCFLRSHIQPAGCLGEALPIREEGTQLDGRVGMTLQQFLWIRRPTRRQRLQLLRHDLVDALLAHGRFLGGRVHDSSTVCRCSANAIRPTRSCTNGREPLSFHRRTRATPPA